MHISRQVEKDEITFSINTENMTANVMVPDGLYNGDMNRQQNYRDMMMELTINVIGSITFMRDAEKTLESLAEEDAFSRALTFSVSAIPFELIFTKPFGKLEFWNDKVTKSFLILEDKFLEQTKMSESKEQPKIGETVDIPEEIDFSNKGHKDHMALSVIDVDLWNKAKWGGMAYGYIFGLPPIMGVMFKDIDAGKKIFQRWRDRFGAIDRDDEIRITIIQGISASNPAYYKFVISSEIPPAAMLRGKTISSVSRYIVMTPSSDQNLSLFLMHYAEHKYFGISPAFTDPRTGQANIIDRLAIGKAKFYFRQAWEIGPHDPECVAISLDDDIYIPADVTDPPITKTLERLRIMRSQKVDSSKVKPKSARL